MHFKKIISFAVFWAITATVLPQNPEMAFIKDGKYTPLYGRDSVQVSVDGFLLDTIPVTINQYREFLKENPKWRKSKAKGLFADKNYLANWEDDLMPNKARSTQSQLPMFPGLRPKLIANAKAKGFPYLMSGNMWQWPIKAPSTPEKKRVTTNIF